jgi:hypothetical protein
MDDQNRLEKTIQLIAQKYSYFDVNERQVITPLSKMIFSTLAFANCFVPKAEEPNDIMLDLIKRLNEMYKDPIVYVLKNCDTNFSEKKKVKISIHKTLGQLEWIFFRDSHRFTSLKKKYDIDTGKPKETKGITFEDLSAIRGFIEKEISRIFTEIVKENNVNLEPLQLPSFSNQQDGYLDMLMTDGAEK